MGLQFNANEHEPNKFPDPLPIGWYAMTIVGAEMYAKEKDGVINEMLKLDWELDEDAHPGFGTRHVFEYLNINHPTSEQARKIANGDLSSICRAIGKMEIDECDDLLGGQARVKLVIDPGKGGYGPSNRTKGYKPLSEAAPAGTNAAAPKSVPGTATAPAASGARPGWRR